MSLLKILTGASLAFVLIGCQTESDNELVATSELALKVCAAPANGTGNVCSPAPGQLQFQVSLPSDQAYVEVFVRQNGIQNVAQAIETTGVSHGDGWSTYSLTRAGYAPGDKIEYRFYSHLPRACGVFTPGTAESTWYGYLGGVPVSKDAAVIYASLGVGPAAGRNFGAEPSVDIGNYHLTSEGLFGYSWAGLVPAGATITRADLVLPSPYTPGGPTVTLRLNQVTAAWSESTVTWNNKPAYTYLRDVQVTQSVENRLDVTDVVVASQAAGEASLALQPASNNINNVFIAAKESTGAAPTSLSIHWIH